MLVVPTSRYGKDRNKMIKQGKNMNLLDTAIELIQTGQPLPKEYNDHPLKGNYKGCQECHIGGPRSDWLLIYQITGDKLILKLMRTGSHSELFSSTYIMTL
jgi:mRNA interferase YafQ